MLEKAMVIDEDFLMRGYVVDSLRKEGVQVFEASSVAEARRWRDSERFDFVFFDLDLFMKAGGGFGEDPFEVLVITTSFRNVEKAIDTVKAGGAYDYMLKPFSSDQVSVIVSRCRDVIRLRSRVRALESRAVSMPVGEIDAAPVEMAEATTNLQELERQTILRVLRETDGSRVMMADMLGISVRTLRNKLARYRQEAVAV